VAVPVALGLTGCQVNTRVSVDEVAGGRGVIQITVTFDPSATAAIGGSSALADELQDADLTATGWVVRGPLPGPHSTTVVTATHPFATLTQASVLVEELAGGGPASQRPFRLALTAQHGFWRSQTTLTGAVDLDCGLACFGDSGLTHVLGYPTGVNPGPLVGAAHEQPAELFTFSVGARLPGSLVTTNAATHQGGTLEWTPRLGQSIELTAVTRVWNRGRIVTAAIAAGAAVLVVVGALALWWRARRRRRRRVFSGRGSLRA